MVKWLACKTLIAGDLVPYQEVMFSNHKWGCVIQFFRKMRKNSNSYIIITKSSVNNMKSKLHLKLVTHLLIYMYYVTCLSSYDGEYYECICVCFSGVFLVTYIALVCCPSVRRKWPSNFICLTVFVCIVWHTVDLENLTED